MTCREKLKIDHPELVNDECMGGCFGCPNDYWHVDELISDEFCAKNRCEECWDQEVEED